MINFGNYNHLQDHNQPHEKIIKKYNIAQLVLFLYLYFLAGLMLAKVITMCFKRCFLSTLGSDFNPLLCFRQDL